MINILIFKTDIDNEQKFNYVNYLFKNHPQIFQWSLDNEDIDNVLRIEASEKMIESEIIQLLNGIGVHCEDLTY